MDVKVAIIQASLYWENAFKNRQMFDRKIDEIPGDVDLIVLPEMFTTGFSMNASELAERMHGQTMKWMEQKALEKQAVICGSLIILEEGRFYNRLIWMDPFQAYKKYDKRHLFSLANEQDVYAPGKEKLITGIGEWKICPQICYDLRFPVWNRNAENYDLFIIIANWPERRNYPWKTLLRARAIENQCYVVGVNRVGIDGNGVEHSGDSAIIDPLGEVIFEKSGEEVVHVEKLSLEKLQLIRQKFNFLPDRDQFEVIL